MVNSTKLDEILQSVKLYQRNELNSRIEPYYFPKNERTEISEEENVFEANAYQFGNNLGEGTTFGVTFIYGGKIVLLDTLKGDDRDKVLKHEKHHRNNICDSEYMTRMKTNTEDFSPNSTISPCCYN